MSTAGPGGVNTDLIPSAPFAIDTEAGLIVDRATGEAYTLAEAPAQTLAAFDDYVREQQQFWKLARQLADDELTGRLKAERARTARFGAHLVELERKRVWDVTATWEALQGLVAAGLIAEADADEACPEKTERKPDGRKLNALLTQLAGEDPEAAQPLAKARSESTWIKLSRTAVEGEVVE